MKQITNKEYEEYQRYLDDKNNGRLLTTDGIDLIIRACGYDAQKIGLTILEQRHIQIQNDKKEDSLKLSS